MAVRNRTLYFLVYPFLLSCFLISHLTAQDLVITDSLVIEDSTIVLNGNLLVKAGGSLTLSAVDLRINCSFNGEYRIEVEPEGSLYIINNSILAPANLEFRFAFAVHGKYFEMHNSELQGVGWGDEDELNNDQQLVMSGSKGLIVTTDFALIDSCKFSGSHVGLIMADSGAVISNNQFYDNNAQALFIRDAVSQTVSGNYILNERGSAALHITSDKNCKYINNEIIANHGHGIVTGHIHHSLIENNKIRSELISIFMLGAGTYNIIRDNDILSNEVAFQLWGRFNEVRNNTVSSYWGWMGTGMFIIYSYNSIIEDNVFTDVNEANGIWLKHSSNNLIRNNRLEAKEELPGDWSSGILLFSSSKHNHIQGNSITGFHRGISLCGSSDHNILYDNAINSSHYWGLILASSDSNYIFSNNVLIDNPNPLYDNGSNFHDFTGELPEWVKADVQDLPIGYDDIITGDVVIEDQTFELGNFIVTEGSSLTINNSTLITGKNGMSGLWTENGSSLFIDNCKFLMHEYGDGFELVAGKGSTFIMTDSEVDGVGFEYGVSGLYLDGDSVIIERNRIDGTTVNFISGDHGIFRGNVLTNMMNAIMLYKNPSNILIEDNVIDGAYHAGILGTGTNITILNNRLTNMWGAGINLWLGSGNSIIGDTITNVFEPFPAINADEDETVISDNLIFDSFHGIQSGGSGSQISGNVVYNCKQGMRVWNDQIVHSNHIHQCDEGVNIRGNNNVIHSNVIRSCDLGLEVDAGAMNDLFYSNDILMNKYQAHDFGGVNWDNDTIGNFWSDYLGFDDDGDGIGDTPYHVFSKVYDRFPLMGPLNTSVTPITGNLEITELPSDRLKTGDLDVPIIKMIIHKSVAESSNQFEWHGLRLDVIGHNLDEDTLRFKVYRDINFNSSIETGVDSLLGSALFSSGLSVLWFDKGEMISTDPGHYLVALDMPGQLTAKEAAIGLNIRDSSCFITLHPAKFLNTNLPFSTNIFDITPNGLEENLQTIFLSQNSPNPFHTRSRIFYTIPVEGPISLVLYDQTGKVVSILVEGVRQPGSYEIELNGRGLPNGIFYYRLCVGNSCEIKMCAIAR